MIDIERRAGILGLAFRVGNGAAQYLLDIACRALFREAQNLQRIFGALTAIMSPPVESSGRRANVPRHRDRLNRRSLTCFVRRDICHKLINLLAQLVRRPRTVPRRLLARPVLLERPQRPPRVPAQPSRRGL